MATTRRRVALTLSLMVASLTLATPACAQFARGRAALDQVRTIERAQFRDFWDDRGWSYRNNSPGSFWGDRRPSYPNRSYDPYNPNRRQQVYESIKPPAPRKMETPPAETVVVIGDLFAEWLAYGLEQVFAETPQIGIVRKVKSDLGLVRDDARLDAPEWTQAIKDLLPATEKANAIVVMLGVNDRSSLRERTPPAKEASSPSDNNHPAPAGAGAQRAPPSASFEFHTDKWAELYSKRIDDMIAALQTRGVPIIWVGLPAIRGSKSTTDMSYLDELYRARADKAGIAYVDIWDGFVDDQGRYVQDGPDFEGQTRRLRVGFLGGGLGRASPGDGMTLGSDIRRPPEIGLRSRLVANTVSKRRPAIRASSSSLEFGSVIRAAATVHESQVERRSNCSRKMAPAPLSLCGYWIWNAM